MTTKQNYTFLGELSAFHHTFLGELSALRHTFLGELSAFYYTFLGELLILHPIYWLRLFCFIKWSALKISGLCWSIGWFSLTHGQSLEGTYDFRVMRLFDWGLCPGCMPFHSKIRKAWGRRPSFPGSVLWAFSDSTDIIRGWSRAGCWRRHLLFVYSSLGDGEWVCLCKGRTLLCALSALLWALGGDSWGSAGFF